MVLGGSEGKLYTGLRNSVGVQTKCGQNAITQRNGHGKQREHTVALRLRPSDQTQMPVESLIKRTLILGRMKQNVLPP